MRPDPKSRIPAQQQRGEIRYPYHWPVAVTFVAESDYASSATATDDISLSGCSLLTLHNAKLGDDVRLTVQLPSDAELTSKNTVEMTGRIVRMETWSDRKQYRCGIQFLEFVNDDRNKLERAIKLGPLSSAGSQGSAKVRVYPYAVFSHEHGRFVRSHPPVYATIETIHSLKGRPIIEEGIDLEKSRLNEQGFYHR